MGIEFVWVDSLCIIQDDKEDWHRESKDMAAVYRNAALVVAAAGARDSSEGLFIDDRPEATVLELPYLKSECGEGSFNMALMPRTSIPYGTPLHSRAWAFQEWYLARRIVFFMANSMTWRCAKLEVDDRGAKTDRLVFEEWSWLGVLRAYSRKDLTFPSDRLHALQGIASQLKETRHDHYFAHFGVWEQGLADRLLWTQKAPSVETHSLPLPSWSWAAIGGQKGWVLHLNWSDDRVQIPKTLRATDSGSIYVSGPVINGRLILSHLPIRLQESGAHGIFLDVGEGHMFLGFVLEEAVNSYLIWDHTQKEKVSGIASFDDFDSEPPSEVQCLPLVLATRKAFRNQEFSPVFRKNNNGEYSLQFESALTEPGDSDGEFKLGQSGNDPSDPLFCPQDAAQKVIDTIRTTEQVYWALLSEPTEDGKFRRVGIAALYPEAYEEWDKELAEIEIV